MIETHEYHAAPRDVRRTFFGGAVSGALFVASATGVVGTGVGSFSASDVPPAPSPPLLQVVLEDLNQVCKVLQLGDKAEKRGLAGS